MIKLTVAILLAGTIYAVPALADKQSSNISNTNTPFNGGSVASPITAPSFASTAPTGTAPLTVSSTTNVPNLNASLLTGSAIGTSGATIPLLSTANTWSANQTHSAPITLNGSANITTNVPNGISWPLDTNPLQLFWWYDGTTLSAGSATTNTWQNLDSSVQLTGSGPYNGEVNVVHEFAGIALGTTAAQLEDNEFQVFNFGTLTNWDGALIVPHNQSTGTSAGLWAGIKSQLTNDNTTVGALGAYAAWDNEAMSGAGSVPTSNYLIRNADATAPINSLGNITLGTLAIQTASTKLFIQGSNQLSSGFSVRVQDSSFNDLLDVINDGNVKMGGGPLTLGTSGRTFGNITFLNTTSGQIVLTAPGSGALGAQTLTLPTVTGTLAVTSNTPQTFAGATTFSNTVNLSALTASLPLYTDAGKSLTNTAPSGYPAVNTGSVSCGTGCASVTGSGSRFTATTGTGISSVTVNFGTTWSGGTPVCTVSDNSTTSISDVSSLSASSITIGLSVALTAGTIYVLCSG
jgi:hypothetical protein